MVLRSLLRALLATALLALVGCGDDDKPAAPSGNNTTTTLRFVGTVNGDNGGLAASLIIIITGTNVTGTFHIESPAVSTIALTGLYDTGTKIVAATGGGYSFGGVYDGTNRVEGTMSGTSGGTFVILKDENNTAVAFCGTFTGSDSGVWNFTIDGTTVAGSYTTTTGGFGALDGTISGNNITIANPGGGSPLAAGTRSGDNASGTWDDGGGNSGNWTGSRCN